MRRCNQIAVNMRLGGEKMIKDNNGFSLVELIIAMAIESIVCLAVIGLISYASNNYMLNERELNNQTEAQIVENQVVDRVLTANNVTYSSNDYGSALVIYKIDQINDDYSVVTEKQVIWHRNDKDTCDKKYRNKMYLFTASIEGEMNADGSSTLTDALKAAKQQYYETGTGTQLVDVMKEIDANIKSQMKDYDDIMKSGDVTDAIYKKHLMSDGITQFKATMADAANSTLKDGISENQTVKVTFGFERKTKKYTDLTDTVKIRNKIFEIPD